MSVFYLSDFFGGGGVVGTRKLDCTIASYEMCVVLVSVSSCRDWIGRSRRFL